MVCPALMVQVPSFQHAIELDATVRTVSKDEMIGYVAGRNREKDQDGRLQGSTFQVRWCCWGRMERLWRQPSAISTDISSLYNLAAGRPHSDNGNQMHRGYGVDLVLYICTIPPSAPALATGLPSLVPIAAPLATSRKPHAPRCH